MSTEDVLIVPHDASTAIATLRKRGYDDASIYRYACAARSWAKKNSEEWKIWKEVEKLTSSVQSAGSGTDKVD